MTQARKKSRRSRTHRVFIDDAQSRTFSLDSADRRDGILNHIFAGGMRIETRISREALLARRRRARVWRVIAVLAIAWIAFQFINP